MISHWLDLIDKGELEFNKLEPILKSFAPMLDGLLNSFLPHLSSTHPVAAAAAALPTPPTK